MTQNNSKNNQPTSTAPNALWTKIDALRKTLLAAFQERESIVDALLAAVLAGEHVIMFGPPGTGKSAIARALCGAVDGANYFEWLLNRYTEPNELFGGIDLPKWSAGGNYERRTAGMLPTAHIVNLEEIFKANSSILNALLAIINERLFHDGGKAHHVPLRSVVASSNELPEGPELEALYDRFIVRVNVEYVREQSSFTNIVTGLDPSVPVAMTLAEFDACVSAAAVLPLGSGVVDSLFSLRTELAAEGIIVSDRRWKKLVRLLRSHAWLQGDAEVDTIHFEVLRHGLWRDPREMQKVTTSVNRVASPLLLEATETFDAIMEQVKAAKASAFNADNAATLSGEIKKAVSKLEYNTRGATPAVQNRISPMIDTLNQHRQAIKDRITADL
jgi:MoxR-like ATPase